jgi:hypothetical protein
MEFKGFKPMPRLAKDMVISEKIDGTNGLIFIDGETIKAGSRSRWLSFDSDNKNFFKWVMINKEELITKLGDGYHYGEWYGNRIQRGYGLNEKRFALFNTKRWTAETKPSCCDVVPILYQGEFSTDKIEEVLTVLSISGSNLVKGFMRPEGVVVYHTAGDYYFKKTLEGDSK